MNLITLSVTASDVFSKVWTVLLAILFFGVMIGLHEFGHFITAKLFKVKVNEFAIGMGPKLIKKQRGETLYSLRLLPIGGFCALEGEDDADPDDPRAFGNQKKWKRFIILAAGATMNIILGLLLVCIMLGSVKTTTSAVVSEVGESISSLENAVLPGDKIISVNGGHIFNGRDFYYSLYRGLTEHADITDAEGETVISSENNNKGYFDIKVRRDGKTVKLENVPLIYDAESYICSVIVGNKDIKFYNILPSAVTETCSMARLVFLSLIDMFSGNYGLKDLSGPVGTINMVAETTEVAVSEKDYSSVFFILAFITVNIGLVNLLPLPALDGGRLFFIVVEAVIRKPIPKKFEAVVHAVGFILLLALMALISLNDIINLFRK